MWGKPRLRTHKKATQESHRPNAPCEGCRLRQLWLSHGESIENPAPQTAAHRGRKQALNCVGGNVREIYLYCIKTNRSRQSHLHKSRADLTNGKASTQMYFSKKVKDVWMEGREGRR